MKDHLPSGKLTYTLKTITFYWKLVFQPPSARVHVNLLEGTFHLGGTETYVIHSGVRTDQFHHGPRLRDRPKTVDLTYRPNPPELLWERRSLAEMLRAMLWSLPSSRFFCLVGFVVTRYCGVPSCTILLCFEFVWGI